MSAYMIRPRCGREMNLGRSLYCGRPKGHPGTPEKCLSREAYEHQLDLQNRMRREQRQSAGVA